MASEDLPYEWIPLELRDAKPLPERTEVLYAAGYKIRSGKKKTVVDYSMWGGPTPSLENMLNTVPQDYDIETIILRYNLDGTEEELYFWNTARQRWIRIKS